MQLPYWKIPSNLTKTVHNAIIVRVLIYWGRTVLYHHDEGEN